MWISQVHEFECGFLKVNEIAFEHDLNVLIKHLINVDFFKLTLQKYQFITGLVLSTCCKRIP